MSLDKLTNAFNDVHALKGVVERAFGTTDPKNVEAALTHLIDRAGYGPIEFRELCEGGSLYPKPKRKIRQVESDGHDE